VDNSIASAESRLQMDESSFKSAVEDEQMTVTSRLSGLTASLQQMDEKLQKQSQDIDHFLSTELQQDMPTGECYCKTFIFCVSFMS